MPILEHNDIKAADKLPCRKDKTHTNPTDLNRIQESPLQDYLSALDKSGRQVAMPKRSTETNPKDLNESQEPHFGPF